MNASMFVNFIHYLRRPDCIPFLDLTFGKKLKMTGTMFAWDMITSFGVSLLVVIIFLAGGLPMLHDKMYPVVSGGYATPLYLILIGRVLIAPVLEEVMFRLMVTKFDLLKVKISLSMLMAFILEMVICEMYFGKSLLLEKIFGNVFSLYWVVIALAIIFYLILTCFNRVLQRLNSFWDNYFYIVFYGSALLFCIAHYHRTPLFLLPVMLVTGLFLGYTRVKLGLGYSIILHMAANVTISLSYFA